MVHLECVDSISSTADVLAERARRGCVPHGTLLVAGTQTAGHGRGGEKPFHSPPGGLYLSLLLRNCHCPAGALPMTPRAALAVRRVLARHGCAVGIKWVNDIFIGEKKAGGILTQLVGDCTILSCGLNLWQEAKAPQGLDGVITYCYSCKADAPEPRALALEFAEELLALSENHDNMALLKEYREASVVLGRMVTCWKDGTESNVRSVDITESGALVVEDSDGIRRTLLSGEVHLRLSPCQDRGDSKNEFYFP